MCNAGAKLGVSPANGLSLFSQKMSLVSLSEGEGAFLGLQLGKMEMGPVLAYIFFRRLRR